MYFDMHSSSSLSKALLVGFDLLFTIVFSGDGRALSPDEAFAARESVVRVGVFAYKCEHLRSLGQTLVMITNPVLPLIVSA